MNIIFLAIGILFLAERIWKYAMVEKFFLDLSPNPSPARRGESESNFPLLDEEKTRSNSSLPSQGRGVRSISILQPILSGDSTLWTCLERNLQMKTSYEIEFLWLLDENDRVGLDGCQKLITQYPNCRISLIFLPQPTDGISPKTFKLICGLKEAKGNIIVVLDDDTILPDYGLEECIPYLDKPQVGLAFGLPYYINFSNFWSSLVSCFVNGNSLLTYIPYTFLMQPFTINGMFYAIKREVLERVGCFSGLESAICDDYAIAQRFRSQGYQLAQTPLRHGISTQVETASHYFNIINRWFIFPQASIMRSASVGELSLFYCLVLLPNFFPLLIVGYLFLFHSIYAVAIGLLYFVFNAYIIFYFNRKYLNNATPNNKIIWILITQILLPFQIIWSLVSPRKINWRGHIMEVDREGGFKFIQRRS